MEDEHEPPLVGALRNLAHAVALLPDNELIAWAAVCIEEARGYRKYSPDHPAAVTALALSDARQALADVLITIAEVPNDNPQNDPDEEEHNDG